MYKWTDDDHELVQILTAQGLTVAQISNETGLSVGGIKRSRAVNRGSPDPKAQRADNLGSSDNLGSILAELASVNEQLADVKEQLAEALKWINAKKKREAKELEYTDKRPTFQFKRAGPM